ncbi:SUN domain-containing protein 1-like isoform X3 [Esox lucius]|uniref:SUN domain-containing protein n=3 Tax=Esox lucius TaxID=8010 RepID=A0A3P8YXI6_ESOLU|nr:SUN domain-containing protein 1-like isoform X3 [Esox lucius]XP_019907048.1 SUN domain-containing protein 1-like isoform X3 [Esox lucius]
MFTRSAQLLVLKSKDETPTYKETPVRLTQNKRGRKKVCRANSVPSETSSMIADQSLPVSGLVPTLFHQSKPVKTAARSTHSRFHYDISSWFSILLLFITVLLTFFLVFQYSTGFPAMNLIWVDSQPNPQSHQNTHGPPFIDAALQKHMDTTEQIVQRMTKEFKGLRTEIDHLKKMMDSLTTGERHIQDQQVFHRERIMALDDVSSRLWQEVSSLQQSVKDSNGPPAIKMADYALESQGGTIVTNRRSKTHETGSYTLSIMGIPLLKRMNSPWTVIEGNPPKPGRCWPFQGSQGYLTVSLSCPIHITHVTVEHIPVVLSPTGNIHSAPKDFNVYGMSTEEEEGTLLGTFTFSQAGDAAQTFELPKPSSVYRFVELQVLTNWGNKDYTCLYRFQVHGKMPSD